MIAIRPVSDLRNRLKISILCIYVNVLQIESH